MPKPAIFNDDHPIVLCLDATSAVRHESLIINSYHKSYKIPDSKMFLSYQQTICAASNLREIPTDTMISMIIHANLNNIIQYKSSYCALYIDRCLTQNIVLPTMPATANSPNIQNQYNTEFPEIIYTDNLIAGQKRPSDTRSNFNNEFDSIFKVAKLAKPNYKCLLHYDETQFVYPCAYQKHFNFLIEAAEYI